MFGQATLFRGTLAVIALYGAMAHANECAMKPLKVSAVCGRVEKVNGGSAIPDATVALMDGSGNRVQSVQTDSAGKFEFHDVKKGKYRLVVDRATPNWVVSPIEVTSSGENSCKQPLVVKVDPVLASGSCMGNNNVEKQKLKP